MPTSRSARFSLAVLLAAVVCIAVAAPVEAIGTKIDAGARECYTEGVAAGGSLSLSFRVTDGGGFDIDAVLFAETFEEMEDMGQVQRAHYQKKLSEMREKPIRTMLNEWRRVKEGSHMYTAPSALETKHGLPATVTVCFDNTFSTISPKWIQFKFLKRDVIEVDPSNNDKVETEIAEVLHQHGMTLFELHTAAERMRDLGFADRVQNEFLEFMVNGEVVFNGALIILTSVIIHVSLLFVLRRNASHRSAAKIPLVRR